MIRINLLREPAQPKAAPAPLQSRVLLGFLGCLALLAVILFFWQSRLSSQIESQRQEMEELQQEDNRLKQLQAQLQRFEQERNDLETRLQAVERLQSNREGPVHLMNTIVSAIPEDPTLWLTNLTQRGDTVSIEGRAFDVAPISEFIARLTGRRPLQEVELDFWQREPETRTVKFKLTARMGGV